jgi:hypothetical protein
MFLLFAFTIDASEKSQLMLNGWTKIIRSKIIILYINLQLEIISLFYPTLTPLKLSSVPLTTTQQT